MTILQIVALAWLAGAIYYGQKDLLKAGQPRTFDAVAAAAVKQWAWPWTQIRNLSKVP